MSCSPLRLTDRKRAAIVQAAVEEFRSAGYEATSMDRIALAAGVSKRTVYNHFPSKEALFELMLEQLWARSASGEDLTYRATTALADQLRQLLLAKLGVLSDPHFIDLARVALAEVIHAPERAQAIVRRIETTECGLTNWIAAAIRDGRLRLDDPEFAAQQLHGLVKSFAFWPQITLGRAPLSLTERGRVADSAVAMFLAAYSKD
ncbi:TetR/AcrR family transcriptional regulator [Frateuria aurantia]